MKYLTAILIILFTACSTAPSEADIQTALANTKIAMPTNTPEPSPTPTLIPLEDLDLTSLLIHEGDLPPGFSGAQIRDTAVHMFDDVPEADKTIYHQFESKSDSAGGVTVFLYNSFDIVNKAYEIILDGFWNGIYGGRNTVENVGEKAEATWKWGGIFGDEYSKSDFAFIRCHAVIHIRFSGIVMVDPQPIISYAQRLDERLIPLVCRE